MDYIDGKKTKDNLFILMVVVFCCCLLGCGSETNNIPVSFKERQKQLFYGINHKLVYESCQNLMRQFREGTLPDNLFFCDDPAEKQKILPEPVLSLHPIYVHVIDIKTDIVFFDAGRTQLLRCDSNEFGNPVSKYGKAKGQGYRNNPVAFEKLNGNESLNYLNKRYLHFYIERIPGLEYQTFKEDTFNNLTEVKEKIKSTDLISACISKDMDELAVKRQRLLYKTDHNELLKACREIIVKYKDGAFNEDKIAVYDERFAKDVNKIPKIIVSLEPDLIWFKKDCVRVALPGGFVRCGFVAYADNDDATGEKNDIKLIDGLFYYDDGLKEMGDDFKKYLKGIEKDAISYLNWKRKQMNLPLPDKAKWLKQAESRF